MARPCRARRARSGARGLRFGGFVELAVLRSLHQGRNEEGSNPRGASAQKLTGSVLEPRAFGAGHEHLGFNDWDAPVCFDNLKVTPL